mgnify:CR=1 FL=1
MIENAHDGIAASHGDLAGYFLIENILAYPIKYKIKKDAVREGRDMQNPRRKFTSFAAPAIVTVMVAPVVGLAALLPALMVYERAINASYPDDRE